MPRRRGSPRKDAGKFHGASAIVPALAPPAARPPRPLRSARDLDDLAESRGSDVESGMHTTKDRTVVVLGGSRGLGRGMVEALAAAGSQVVAVARDAAALREVEGERVRAVVGDATDGGFVTGLLQAHDPDVIVVALGALPTMLPLALHTWETFSNHWHVDVKATFYVLRTLLSLPSRPGRRVLVVSSGAALAGASPLSGGYAACKQAQRFLVKYANAEAKSRGVDLAVQCILPQLTPSTRLGQIAVRAYYGADALDLEAYARVRGSVLTPAVAGHAVVDLLGRSHDGVAEFVLDGGGLKPVPA